jgi:hypothetical protein
MPLPRQPPPQGRERSSANVASPFRERRKLGDRLLGFRPFGGEGIPFSEVSSLPVPTYFVV